MRLEDTKAANYTTQEELEAGTSIAKSVVGLTTRFGALNTGFGNFLYSDQHFPALFQCPIPPGPKHLDINEEGAASRQCWSSVCGHGAGSELTEGWGGTSKSLHLTRITQSSASAFLHQTGRFLRSQDLFPATGMLDTSEGQPQTSQDIPPAHPKTQRQKHRAPGDTST